MDLDVIEMSHTGLQALTSNTHTAIESEKRTSRRRQPLRVPGAATSKTKPAFGRRFRVTQACDQCREARRKCDTSLPACAGCRRQNQACTYQRVAKKRGNQPGYLGALEMSLGLLLEQLPASRDIITGFLDGDCKGESELSIHNSHMAGRLRVSWLESPVYKDINTLLSSENPPQILTKGQEELKSGYAQEWASGGRSTTDGTHDSPRQWPIL